MTDYEQMIIFLIRYAYLRLIFYDNIFRQILVRYIYKKIDYFTIKVINALQKREGMRKLQLQVSGCANKRFPGFIKIIHKRFQL